METFVERNFRVAGHIGCYFAPPSGATLKDIQGIEVQVWQQSALENILLGKGLTDENGDFVIDIQVDSPTVIIEDGKIHDVFLKGYYNGQQLAEVEYDEDALLYFEQLSPQPSGNFKVAVNNLVLKLKADNNWDKLDRLWIHAAEYQQNARVSLVNPTSTQITENGSPAWAAGSGYTGNGSSSYLNTNYNPTSSATNYAQNSGALFVYIRNNTSTGSFIEMGCGPTGGGTAGAWIGTRGFSDQMFIRINETTTLTTSSSDSSGFWVANRSTSSNINLYKNGTSVLNSTSHSSTGVPNYNIYVLCGNNAGSAANFSDREISLSGISSGALDQTPFYNAIQEFATLIGFNI